MSNFDNNCNYLVLGGFLGVASLYIL